MSENNFNTFKSLELHDGLLKNLDTLKYGTMTPIQTQSLPIMLKGKDVIAEAKTGSGKTIAFGLCLLNKLNIERYAVQTLILCPTRELAEQVCQVLRQLARLMPNVKVLNLSGGTPMKPQLDSLRHGAHIVVGTPGRVQKHLDGASLTLKHLQTLILDEADRMLDMGFFDAMTAIIERCPTHRQTLLFSATYPAEIKQLAREFMREPTHVVIDEKHTELAIEQYFYEVAQQKDKYPLLKQLLLHHKPTSALIFCNTKDQTVQISAALAKDGFSAMALNGDLEQRDRDVAIIRFANQSVSLLVATDVAARGLDIKELPLVINFDLAFEDDVHTHRIGRTGRAGSKGLALSLTIPADGERLALIEEKLGKAVTWGDKTFANHGMHYPKLVTIAISAGKKDKIRPGDILGILTKEAGLPSDKIGKIDIGLISAYVAIDKSVVDKAYQFLSDAKLKGRKIAVKKLK